MSRHGWTSENCSYTNNQKLYCYFSPFKNSNLINNKQAFFSVIIIKVVSTEFMNSLVFNKKCPEK